MTNLIPKDVWMGILSFLDLESIYNVAQTCRTLKNYTKDNKVTQLVQRHLAAQLHLEQPHPFERLARFYVSYADPKAFSDPAIQDSIKKALDTRTQFDPSNVKDSKIFQNVLACGKLGVRLTALTNFKKAVQDPSLSSETVVSELEKLAKIKWLNRSIYHPLTLKDNNAMEAIKHFTCESNNSPNEADFGFTFIKNNPHSPKILEAINAAELDAKRQSNVCNEFEMDPKLSTLLENYQLSHFIQLHDESNDQDAILLQFSNLHPAYQNLFKTKICEAVGKQITDSDFEVWAENELKQNLKGEVINNVKQQFRKLLFTLTPEDAEKSIKNDL